MLNFFKKNKDKAVKFFEKVIPETAIHPRYYRLIEKAFEINGKTFWCFKNIMDMPVNRYLQLGTFHDESLFKMTYKNLSNMVDKQEEYLNKGDITKAMMINSEIKLRLNLKFDPDLLFRLASCVYFYQNEILTDYDFDIGDEKINLFKKENLDSFFLRKPLSDLIPVKNISTEDIKIYSKALERRKAYLKDRMDLEYF